MTQAELQQQILAVFDAAERDARATLEMIARGRAAFANGVQMTTTSNGVTGIALGGSRIRRNSRLTLADHIADVLREHGLMKQPASRDALIAKGFALNAKAPLSAIATALARKEGELFTRGDNLTWGLIEPPAPQES